MSDGERKLLLMRALFQKSVGDFYEMETMKTSRYSFAIQARKCPALHVFRDAGAEQLDLCEGHEVYWQRVATSLDPHFNFKVTKSLKWGDDHCEFACELENPNRRG